MEHEKVFQGKVALVTGVGRLNGIGAAICQALAERGADIFFTYWNPYDQQVHSKDPQFDPLAFESTLKSRDVRVAHAEADLSNSVMPEKLFLQAEQALGRIDILINNACYDEEVPFISLSSEILDKHYAVNVRAVTLLCREFVKRGTPGHIINMTSGQSLGSMSELQIAYTTTKAALEMLVKQLAPSVIQQGIMIHAFDPGPTDTGWMSEEMKEQIRKESTKGRLTVPADVGTWIVELLTKEDSTTGQVIQEIPRGLCPGVNHTCGSRC